MSINFIRVFGGYSECVHKESLNEIRVTELNEFLLSKIVNAMISKSVIKFSCIALQEVIRFIVNHNL